MQTAITNFRNHFKSKGIAINIDSWPHSTDTDDTNMRRAYYYHWPDSPEVH